MQGVSMKIRIGDLVRHMGHGRIGVILRDLVPNARVKRYLVHWGDYQSSQVVWALEVINENKNR